MRDAGCGSRAAWLGGWEIERSGLVGSPRSLPRLVKAAGVIAGNNSMQSELSVNKSLDDDLIVH
jgi:hypothetical protein